MTTGSDLNRPSSGHYYKNLQNKVNIYSMIYDYNLFLTCFEGFCNSGLTIVFARQTWSKACIQIYISVVESSWNAMAHSDAQEEKWRGNWQMEWVASTLHTTSEHGVSSITTALMRTPRLPVVVWTDTPIDLNGLVCFARRRNLVSARVPSRFKCRLLMFHIPSVNWICKMYNRQMHFNIMINFYENMLDNMFRPVIRPSSGWRHKDTIVVTCVTITP